MILKDLKRKKKKKKNLLTYITDRKEWAKSKASHFENIGLLISKCTKKNLTGEKFWYMRATNTKNVLSPWMWTQRELNMMDCWNMNVHPCAILNQKSKYLRQDLIGSPELKHKAHPVYILGFFVLLVDTFSPLSLYLLDLLMKSCLL